MEIEYEFTGLVFDGGYELDFTRDFAATETLIADIISDIVEETAVLRWGRAALENNGVFLFDEITENGNPVVRHF